MTWFWQKVLFFCLFGVFVIVDDDDGVCLFFVVVCFVFQKN